MKIIILDYKTIGKDVSLDEIKIFGELTIYETTSPENTIERIKDADIVITNKVIIDKNELKAAKKLKLICVAATGYNNININEANKYNIVVTNVKGYSTESVAQQVFSYILAFNNSIFEYQKTIKNNEWQNSDVFTILNHPITELKGQKIGIIGYGTIGKRVAQIAKVFGMNILIGKIPGRKYQDKTRTDLSTIYKESDIITIHCPLTDLTKNLIGQEQLNQMKKTAILINYARGGIVNENDLYFALKNKKIKGAIVDVLSKEPPKDDNILLKAPNIFITPHIAWTSVEARKKLVQGIANNIRLFKQGQIDEIKL